MTFASLPVNHILDGDLSWDSPSVVEEVEFILNSTEWFEDVYDNLYIIDPEECDVYASPDNELASDLVHGVFWAKQFEKPMGELADIAGVDHIPQALRRFTKEDGFHHA